MAKTAKKAQTRPILVPVDFSAHSEAALLFASELAECIPSPLIVLHVVHDPGDAPGFYAGRQSTDDLKKIEDVASEMMDDFMKRMITDHPDKACLKRAETKLLVGLPVARILEAVEKVQAHMVVMGSKGRTGLSHILLGSKAEQVVRLCPVPVTIVKAQEAQDQ
ncbi:MAG: universal stress protein [Arenicellales bacterium]|nr:universal stress protein [Arenicellales bacterium]